VRKAYARANDLTEQGGNAKGSKFTTKTVSRKSWELQKKNRVARSVVPIPSAHAVHTTATCAAMTLLVGTKNIDLQKKRGIAILCASKSFSMA
jgi:hypothetical protein